MRNINGYRDYYDKDLEYLIEEEAKYINNLRVCTRIAKNAGECMRISLIEI